jgi:hypothetical protein
MRCGVAEGVFLSGALWIAAVGGCSGKHIVNLVGTDAGGGARGEKGDGAASGGAAADGGAPSLDSGSGGHLGGASGSGDAADAGNAGGYSLGPRQMHDVPKGDLGWIDAVAIADVTADGRADALVLSDKGLFLYAQRADGTLGDPKAHPYDPHWIAPGLTHTLAVLDLDRNGKLDVVMGHSSGVLVFASDGGAELKPPVQLIGQPCGSRLRVADIDLDGTDDLVTIGDAKSDLIVWYGDGTGGVRETGIFNPGGDYGNNFRDFTLADLTGDGIRDLAALSPGSSPRVHAYAHDGAQSFKLAELAVSFPLVNVDSIEAGDLGGDSLTDLFVTEPGGTPGHLWVIRQSATADLAPAEWLYEYETGEPLVVTDVDGDHDDDVIVLHGGWNLVGVYLQTDGKLEPRRAFPIVSSNHHSHHAIAVGDLSGDGCRDVAIADYNYELMVLHGRGCAGK